MTFKYSNLLKNLLGVAFLVLAVIAFADWRVSNVSSGKLFANAEQVPPHDVALLLGISPKVGTQPNFFYVERIKATAALWKLGKVRGILFSGDNSKPSYNEPDHMKKDLIEAGVAAEYITCDYAGLRTLDSVVRASKVFGLRSLVIVTQKEHLERALYLALSRWPTVVSSLCYLVANKQPPLSCSIPKGCVSRSMSF